MSKVAIQGNASGTGTFTLAAPNSNTDRTLTLPDEAGTVLTSASTIIPSSSGLLAFRVGDSTNQTITHGSTTKVTFTEEDYDLGSCFASSTFTPNVAGYYWLHGNVHWESPTGSNYVVGAWIYKNGERLAIHQQTSNGGVGRSITNNPITVVYANGSTDYFEIYAYLYDYDLGGNANIEKAHSPNHYNTYFEGYLVGAA
jgi:hypothetical protein